MKSFERQGSSGEGTLASPGAMATASRRADDAADCHAVSSSGFRPQPRDGGQAGGSYGALEPAAERAQELLHREFLSCPVAGLRMLARLGCQPEGARCVSLGVPLLGPTPDDVACD